MGTKESKGITPTAILVARAYTAFKDKPWSVEETEVVE